MIAAVGALALGSVAAWLLAQRAGDLFAVDALERRNYRDATLHTGVGVLLAVVALAAVAVEQVVLAVDGGRSAPAWAWSRGPALVALLAFTLLGLLDDVAGVGQSGGFRGHLAALARGRPTSGVVKLLGGAAAGVAVAASAGSGAHGGVALLRDGAIVALAANLANLFDRAPGRAVKVATVGFVAALLVARDGALVAPALGVGAGLGLLGGDLRERYMLGDAGANPLGALVGLSWLLAVTTAAGRWLVLVVLAGANLASEVVSFSRIIDATPPLRWLDRLGSRRA